MEPKRLTWLRFCVIINIWREIPMGIVYTLVTKILHAIKKLHVKICTSNP
jgi:hypothetical protein